jgi:hypothetical protein
MLVRERFEAVQVPHRIAGTTTRAEQVVRNDCTISAVYKIREATGTAFLTQSQLVHLRLRVPISGTAYELACLGPLVAELPAGAWKIEATARDLSGGRHTSLSVRTHIPSVRLAPGRPARPAPHKQLIAVDWPRRPGPAYDDYRVELGFRLAKAPLVRERVVVYGVDLLRRLELPATDGAADKRSRLRERIHGPAERKAVRLHPAAPRQRDQ